MTNAPSGTIHPEVRRLERQEDLRHELLRFCRFLEAQGFALTLRHGRSYYGQIPDFDGLVEQALAADEKNWFAEAQKAGYAQDGGRGDYRADAATMDEAGKLVTDACYLLSTNLARDEYEQWRGRWLRGAEDYLTGRPHFQEAGDAWALVYDVTKFEAESTSDQPKHTADALVIDACYLFNLEAEGQLDRADYEAWRERWLRDAETYLVKEHSMLEEGRHG